MRSVTAGIVGLFTLGLAMAAQAQYYGRPPPPPPPPPQYGPHPWVPPPNWNQRFELGCGSSQHRYGFCQVDVGRHGRVYMRRQTSKSACIEGQTWGWNRAGIWVDRGCGARFVVDRRW